MKTHASGSLLRLARATPGLTKPVLRLAARALPRSKNGQAHWFLRRVASELNYRIPVDMRLGNGMKIRVVWTDEAAGEIFSQGYYEVPTVRIFHEQLRPGIVFVDVGAHVGQYTLVAARMVGPSGAVHSFEPDPETFPLLEHNVVSNRLSNVRLNACAVGETCGSVRLYPGRPDNIGTTSMREPENSSGQPVQVPCRTLDDYVEENAIAAVGLVKMDVEGAELQALHGAVQILSRKPKPTLIVEFCEMHQRAFGASCAELAEFLRGFGYGLFRIEPAGLVPYAPRATDRAAFNVLAMPG